MITVTLSSKSILGGGQSFRLPQDHQSLNGLHSSLADIVHTPIPLSSEYRLFYVDSEQEEIEISDQNDFETCLEELKTLSPDLQKPLEIVLKKNDKISPSQSLIESTVITSKTFNQSVIEVKSIPPVTKEEPQSQPLTASTTVSPSYRFNYSPEELEVIKKVPHNVFTKIEKIFADKCEKSLTDGEKSFKIYHEQQIKHKHIEFQKKFEELSNHFRAENEKLRQQLQSAGIQCSSALTTSQILSKPSTGVANATTSTSAIGQSTGMFGAALLQPIPPPPIETLTTATSTSTLPHSAPLPRSDQGQKHCYQHLEVTCDGCAEYPLQGIRYKSLSKRNFDLCEGCFLADTETKEVYLAMRETEPNNFNQLIQQARNSELSNYAEINRKMLHFHRWAEDFRELTPTKAFSP